MNCLVSNEQKMCKDIFSNYLTVSDDKKATFLWKTKEIRKLMALLDNKNNGSIVSHAITFILSLNREEEPRGINFLNLSKEVRDDVFLKEYGEEAFFNEYYGEFHEKYKEKQFWNSHYLNTIKKK